MARASCNIRGQCETDPRSRDTLEQCQRTCRPLGGDLHTQEVYYQTLAFDFDLARKSAPSDRTQILRRMTGLTITDPEASYYFFTALQYNDWSYIYHLGERERAYLIQRFGLDQLHFLIFDLVKPLYQPRHLNWPLVHRLATDEIIELFAGNSEMMRVESAGSDDDDEYHHALCVSIYNAVMQHIANDHELELLEEQSHDYIPVIEEYLPQLIEMLGQPVDYRSLPT